MAPSPQSQSEIREHLAEQLDWRFAERDDVAVAQALYSGEAVDAVHTLDEAGLSPMARGFYLANRRVANGRAKRVLGWRPRYATFVEGLAAVREAESAGTDLARRATDMPSSNSATSRLTASPCAIS